MKKKNNLVLLMTLISFSVFAQCPTINCPADISLGNDSGLTTAIVNYAIPIGVDSCFADSVVFDYTGAIVQWTVPIGVTSVRITAKGAEGGTNTSSTFSAGLGAIIIGDFGLIPGAVFKVLVGENNMAGNGGGGGTFFTDTLNAPVIIAGGGGGSGMDYDTIAKHGQAALAGGSGSGGGGAGGTAGSGGSVGASFTSGAGGGLLTDGADGWTANSGGDAFVNGGAGANVGFGIGGFGGGGNGSGVNTGGGGGGYSGGGAASSSLGNGGVGGGGGSFNAGTNQVNTAGANLGNGQLVVKWNMHTDTAVLVSGLGSGAAFPIGTTTETYRYYSASGDSVDCSFNITVVSTADIKEEAALNALQLFPNPSNGVFSLEYPNPKMQNLSVEIFDNTSNIVFSNTYTSSYINEEIDISKSANGVYFIRITNDNQSFTRKIIKQ
jgi:hypothetical protein